MAIKFTILKESQSLRIDKFLAKKGLNFALMQKLFRKKLVKVGQKRVLSSYKLELGDEVQIFANLDLEPHKTKKSKLVDLAKLKEVKNSIIFKDDNLIALNKQSGVAVQGGSNIGFNIDDCLPYLKFDNEEIPKLVHRLDKDTSGILLIARNRICADVLTEAFRDKKINKTYLAIVKGIPAKKEGVIEMKLIKKYQGKNEKVYRDDALGKEAVTNYKLIKSYPNKTSLLELKPITGRTHQLRVHLKEIGHPIIGDVKYGGMNVLISGMQKRLHLHAFKIDMEDFFGKRLNLECKMPSFII